MNSLWIKFVLLKQEMHLQMRYSDNLLRRSFLYILYITTWIGCKDDWGKWGEHKIKEQVLLSSLKTPISQYKTTHPPVLFPPHMVYA